VASEAELQQLRRRFLSGWWAVWGHEGVRDEKCSETALLDNFRTQLGSRTCRAICNARARAHGGQGGMSSVHSDFGGQSSTHMSVNGQAHTNGPNAIDRDFAVIHARTRMSAKGLKHSKALLHAHRVSIPIAMPTTPWCQ